MRTWALVAASFAFVLGSAAGASAQSATEWDETQRRPEVDRPGEYRTHTTDTWLGIAPVLTGYLPDGGLKLEPTPAVGLRLSLEPADVLEVSLEATTAWPFQEIEEEFGERNIPGGFDIDEDGVEGRMHHLSAWLHLRNPELEFGAFAIRPGLGIGAFYLDDYEEDVRVDTGTGTVEATVVFDDTWLLHFSPEVRFDIDVSERFRIGLNLRAHITAYAIGDVVGNLDEEDFDPTHVIWEPAFYLAFLF